MSQQQIPSDRFRRAGRTSIAVLLVAVLITGLTGHATPARAVVPGTNGKIAFLSQRDGNAEIYAMNPDGTGQTNLSNNQAYDYNPAWSPDGTKIAFHSDRDGNPEIYVMNADGTGQTRLTNDPAFDVDPSWSPDGTKIAFESTRDGNAEIYVMNADGTGQTRLTTNQAFDTYPAWSSDGTKIAFSSGRDGGNGIIFVMNADGTAPRELTDGTANDIQPAWSPDGTKIAFGRLLVNGTTQIDVMNADGTGLTNLTGNIDGNLNPAWSPDGTKIAFFSNRNGNAGIYVMNGDGTGATQLSSGFGDSHPSWASVGADVSVALTDAPDPVRLGDSVTYTATVANGGPESATGVRLTDAVTAKNAKLVSAAASSGSCTLTKQAAICELGTLPVGQSATVTVVAKPQKKDVLVNTASVTADQIDPDSQNNIVTETTTVG